METKIKNLLARLAFFAEEGMAEYGIVAMAKDAEALLKEMCRAQPEQAQQAEPVAADPAVAAIQFALETHSDGLHFLRLWNEGEFDLLRREWPEAPEDIYIGADPLLEAPAQPPAVAVPVALSAEWAPCVKLPVTVHVREQRQGETHVSTREGITPILPSDLIMRGVMGEEYPIGRELFERTYRFGKADAQPAVLARIDAEREACAVAAWNHFMDVCRRKNVHPADFDDWNASASIRAMLAAAPQAVATGWIDPNDKTQKQFLPHIGEPVLFCHDGVTYYGVHTGGSFKDGHGVTARTFGTWDCLWMYPPAAAQKGGA